MKLQDFHFRFLLVLLAIAGALGVTPTLAQSASTEHTLKSDDPDKRPPASIDDIAWLAGSWEGEAFGGTFEEVWTPPSVGTMTGLFKLMHGGQVTLYEIELIVEEAGSLELRVKHFTREFSAWEEKDEYVSFPLVKLIDEAAYFEGMTIRRVSEDQLQVFLVTTESGEVSEVELTYRRVRGHH